MPQGQEQVLALDSQLFLRFHNKQLSFANYNIAYTPFYYSACSGEGSLPGRRPFWPMGMMQRHPEGGG